jgi:phosphoserine phosphatase
MHAARSRSASVRLVLITVGRLQRLRGISKSLAARLVLVAVFKLQLGQYAAPMKSRQFAPCVADALESLFQVETRDVQPVAVFDADGTLWDTDASEDLLDWLDERTLVTPPRASSSLRDYSDRLCAIDRRAGYAWAATAMVGQRASDVSEWAEACFLDRIEARIYPTMASLVSTLHTRGWSVHIVSASPRWAIEPGAKRLGIASDNISALDAHVIAGPDGVLRYTGRLKGNITSGSGKPLRILEAIGSTPLFVAGNTVDDVPMLRLATHSAMVVNPAAVPDDATCLATLAEDAGWLIHRTR